VCSFPLIGVKLPGAPDTRHVIKVVERKRQIIKTKAADHTQQMFFLAKDTVVFRKVGACLLNI